MVTYDFVPGKLDLPNKAGGGFKFKKHSENR